MSGASPSASRGVEQVVIQGVRKQAKTWIVLSLIMMAVFVWVLARAPGDDLWAWAGLGAFGLSGLIQGWLYVRPQTLTLEADGFTLSGGLIWAPRQIAWRDVEEFVVFRVRDGEGMSESEVIGFNFAPGVKKRSLMRGVMRRLAADGALPSGWPDAPEQMVADLNAYRRAALAAAAVR